MPTDAANPRAWSLAQEFFFLDAYQQRGQKADRECSYFLLNKKDFFPFAYVSKKGCSTASFPLPWR